MHPPHLAALSSIVLALASCSAFETVPEEDPLPVELAPVTEFAAHLPTFDIRVDAEAFAEMTARYTEDIELEAEVWLWRGAREILSGAPAEIQVRGNASARFPLKSLGVKLDEGFDNGRRDLLDAPHVLPGQSLSELRNFRLRNGGNDFVGTLIKDLGYARMLAASGLRVAPIYGEPAAAFVNGEFYGLLNLRTEGNANGVSRLLEIRKRDLLLAEVNYVGGATEAQPFEVKHGDVEVFRQLEADIRAGDRAAALAAVDEAGFIDFVLVHTGRDRHTCAVAREQPGSPPSCGGLKPGDRSRR